MATVYQIHIFSLLTLLPKIFPTSSSGTDKVIVVSGSNTSGVSPLIAGGAFLAARLLLPTSGR